MFQADFAVSTASSTTYELLALKTPIICTPVVPNQEPIAEALREHDAAIVLKYDDEKMDFSSAIQSYMINSSLRRQHRNTGIELIDGQGTVRVAKKILDYIKY
jgi:spore coat polysaccharide biosynthesis predicted glycosyltransferase SpsG